MKIDSKEDKTMPVTNNAHLGAFRPPPRVRIDFANPPVSQPTNSPISRPAVARRSTALPSAQCTPRVAGASPRFICKA